MEVVPPPHFRNHQSSSSTSAAPGRFTAYMSGHMSGPSHNSTAHFSSYSQPSSLRSSDSTQATSSSTLFNPPQLPTPVPIPTNTSGPVGANDSVLNKRGDKEASLFQICLNLRLRLGGLPGFEEALCEEEEDAGDDADPVTVIWRFLRRGYPLMDLYNALGPRIPLVVDPNKVGEKKRGQAATFKFVQACMTELGVSESFMVLDLYGDDTTGFVKVTRVVNQVLDILVKEGILKQDAPDAAEGALGGKRTQRQHIIGELVTTERTYVQHLELLQNFKTVVEAKGIISGDAIHDIFLNLNALLDFQRRFLIRVEQTNRLKEEDQNWGNLFVLYRDAFKVYEPYIANQKKCEEVAMREFNKLKEMDGPPELQQFVENPTVLSAFLLKPFQRLSKYPLLLRELRDKGDLDPRRKLDIDVGIEAASSVLQRTNAAVDREERNDAMAELHARVEDWKGHRLDSFGDLLLHGTFQVIKGDSSSPKDQEREYKIFLFEMILLCCKEVNTSKQKNRVMGRPMVDKKGRPKLQLKGRIFMQNVTDTMCSTKPGSYTCQIFWKGDPGIEYFTIKFNSEETMRRWADQVNTQRKMWKDSARASARPGVSATEFLYMQGQGHIENPYQQQEEDEDDDLDGSTLNNYPSDYPIGRNESNSSLRSRSTTGESMNRMPPRQFPMGSQAPALQLRTGDGSDMPGESFFSPTMDSPVSTRSSGTPSMFPFPRQPMPPLPNGWNDEQSRFTAPAMPRQPSRDGHMNAYQPNSRVPIQRPSLPPTAHSQPNAVQARMRSASSPDIANSMLRRYEQQAPPMPELPPFPNHYAYQPSVLNRSQSSSPGQQMAMHMGQMPIRSAPSPAQIQQQRLTQPHPRSVPLQVAQPDYPGAAQRQMASMAYDAEARGPNGSESGTGSRVGSGESQTSIPTQLKVKVHCPSAGSSMVLVVPVTISYQSLKDRIDAKLQRSTNLNLSAGNVKLKYLDEDDFVSIQSDEDVQMAFETWKESQRSVSVTAGLGEIELYIQ